MPQALGILYFPTIKVPALSISESLKNFDGWCSKEVGGETSKWMENYN